MARIEIGKHLAVDSRICGGGLIFKSTRKWLQTRSNSPMQATVLSK